MTNKVISSTVLATTIAFLALATTQPDSILFLFLSPDQTVGLLRILLAIGMVFLSFRGFINSSRVRSAAKYSGLVLIAFGISSLMFTGLSSAIYDYAKLLDIMIIAEAGIIFTSSALTLPQTAISREKAPQRAFRFNQKTA
jgi:hypothetical protein